ncbi:MAG: hypothetical protein BGO90_02555 [Legionella sp. 40-6]|nr:hypothetical protein [Legionella sp.]OJY01983.1 MAG: hypothetical protein BGO90_02555 [Legionella sp. 40-6]
MKLLLSTVMLLSMFFSTHIYAQETLPTKHYFQFKVACYHTSRQAGQTVNVYVRYAYKNGIQESEYPDYRLLRESVMNYMEPTERFPEATFWEILAKNMAEELLQKYSLAAISVQLDVLDNPSPQAYEPGDHGPTYTIGDIPPLDIHH